MIKKTIFYSLATCSLLFGDYYSAIDATPTGVKTLKFEGGTTINLKNQNLNIKSKYNLKYLLNGDIAKKYKSTTFTIDEKIDNPNNPDEKIIAKKDIIYNTYNFNYILKNNIDDEKFVLKTSNGMMIVKINQNNNTRKSILKNQSQSVTEYEYIVTQSFDKDGNSIKIKEDEILRKYIDNNGGLVAIELLDDGVRDIIKVENGNLTKFLKEKSSKSVTVKKFDFSKERIYTTYLSTTGSSQKRLNIKYEMKKKNIKVTTKSPLSLFDPENNSNLIEQHIGFLRDFKKHKKLIEAAKIQLVDGSKDVQWKVNQKKKVVILNYINGGKKDKKLLSINRGQQFYSIEGVIYLTSWMSKNNIDKKIFTYINGSLPFDVTMSKTAPNLFEMKKSGNTIYKFELDNRNIVKKIIFPSYDISITLESVDSDTTLKNKKYLKEFANKYNIVLIKE